MTGNRACLVLGAILLAVIAPSSLGRAADWPAYRGKEFGYQVSYPAGWGVIEAKPRLGEAAVEEDEVLSNGEVQKVTFLEESYGMYRGRFQVRVLPLPQKQPFKQWVDRYVADYRDVYGKGLVEWVAETSLAGQPAWRIKAFLFETTSVEVAAAYHGRIYILAFAGENPNDPDLEEHQMVYERMLGSFRFQD